MTGAAGFIGSAVSARLLDSGYAVVGVDNGCEPRHAAARARLDRVEWIAEDVHTVDLVKLMRRCTHVVHLAGRPGVQTSWGSGFAGHLHDNTLMAQRVLEAAAVVGGTRVLLASSSSVYGDISAGRAGEDWPMRPVSPYGVSKAALEMLMPAYIGRGVQVSALRFFTAYGRGQRPDMALSRIIEAGLGGEPFEVRGSGTQARDLTHVDDIASAVAAAVGSPTPAGLAINIGTGRSTRLDELISMVGRQLGVDVPVVSTASAPGDPPRTAADVTLAQRLLGWSAKTQLCDGIADQIHHHTPLARAPRNVA